jgi:hypothetical protein
MANISHTQEIEELAAEIGQNIYMDIAKWHLRLDDAHLHKTLAEKFFPMLEENTLDEDRVQEILQSISIKLGGGRRELPLIDLLPRQCETDLMTLLSEFQRQM